METPVLKICVSDIVVVHDVVPAREVVRRVFPMLIESVCMVNADCVFSKDSTLNWPPIMARAPSVSPFSLAQSTAVV